MSGITDGLSRLGRYEEASDYLDQLYRYDSNRRWAHGTNHLGRVRSGQLALDSPELHAFLDDPLSTPNGKGHVLLMLGDVERGVGQLRQMNQTERYFWALHRSLLDQWLPPEVVADPRYGAVLEELGIGDSWRQFLIQKVKEMEPHTGIGYPTQATISMAAIYGD